MRVDFGWGSQWALGLANSLYSYWKPGREGICYSTTGSRAAEV
jgi:hypothetical protein